MTQEIHTLAGAYALNALSDEEERLFERHLAMCASCALEVDDFRKTTALLAQAQTQPLPEGLRERVLGAVEVTPQVRRSEPAERAQWTRLQSLLAPVAAGLVLALLALGGVVVQQRRDLATLQTARAVQEQAMLAVLSAPDSQRVVMNGTQGGGMVLWSPSTGSAVMIATGLDALSAGQAYQLWLMRDGVPLPSRVFQPSSDGHAVVILSNVPDVFEAAAVTVEDAQGATLPTGPMVLTPA